MEKRQRFGAEFKREAVRIALGHRMKYANGNMVRLGDRVRFEPNLTGVVVCSVDTSEYMEKYPRDQWASYLKHGVLIETVEIGLVHLEENDVALQKEE